MRSTHSLYTEIVEQCTHTDAARLLTHYRQAVEWEAFVGGLVMGMAFGMLLLGIFRVIITS